MTFLIAEIAPEWYDIEGRKVFRPDSRRHSGFRPTFPAGRFVSQPLEHWCSDIADLGRFLAGCEYVSDQEQFGKLDYWQPPEQFEKSKKGDCEDFALFAWRQLLHLDYPARFAVGSASRYGEGHAWVTFEKDGKSYLLEPLRSMVLELPRLSVLSYKPRFSIAWDGEKVSYFEHEDRKISWSLKQVSWLLGEWLFVWATFWMKFLMSLPHRRANPNA